MKEFPFLFHLYFCDIFSWNHLPRGRDQARPPGRRITPRSLALVGTTWPHNRPLFAWTLLPPAVSVVHKGRKIFRFVQLWLQDSVKMSKYVSRVHSSGEVQQKVFPIFDSIFHAYYLTRGPGKGPGAKICNEFDSRDVFLRADQGRAKYCCQFGWIGCSILEVAQKASMRFQFLAYICNPLIK